MTPEDWSAVRTIYQEGIATGNATFEVAPPTWQVWDQGHVQECRIVATDNEVVVGWAALTRISTRKVYAGVADVSVYVAAALRGRSIGRSLLGELIKESERSGFWTLQAGIFPENAPSFALHRGYGFRLVGTRERIGQLNGTWRDVLLLEPTSPGTERDSLTFSEVRMAHIDECVPGRQARIRQTGVGRVAGKTGTIVEVSRIRRPATGPLQDRVTVDIPAHGEVVVTPNDVEILPS